MFFPLLSLFIWAYKLWCEIKWPINNIFLISHTLPLHLAISVGRILKEQRKEMKGQEIQTHPNKCRMYNSRIFSSLAGKFILNTWVFTHSLPYLATTRTARSYFLLLLSLGPQPANGPPVDRQRFEVFDTDKTIHWIADFATSKPTICDIFYTQRKNFNFLFSAPCTDQNRLVGCCKQCVEELNGWVRRSDHPSKRGFASFISLNMKISLLITSKVT